MKVIIIGRNQANDIVVLDPTVSQYHVRLVQNDDRSIYLSVLDRENRTYVNGSEVKGEVRLDMNDVIRIGKTTIPWQEYFGLEDNQDITIDNKGKTSRLFPDNNSEGTDGEELLGLGPGPMIGIGFSMIILGSVFGYILGLRIAFAVAFGGLVLMLVAFFKIISNLISKVRDRNKKKNK